MSKRRNMRQAVRKQGRRSKFEIEVEAVCPEGTTYESDKFNWYEKIPRAVCHCCDSTEVYAERWYTPDFFLPNGIILEAKGIFTAKDRKIALGMRETHPDLDIRYVLYFDNKLTRASKTRYSDWLEKNGFKYTLRSKMKEDIAEWMNT